MSWNVHLRHSSLTISAFWKEIRLFLGSTAKTLSVPCILFTNSTTYELTYRACCHKEITVDHSMCSPEWVQLLHNSTLLTPLSKLFNTQKWSERITSPKNIEYIVQQIGSENMQIYQPEDVTLITSQILLFITFNKVYSSQKGELLIRSWEVKG